MKNIFILLSMGLFVPVYSSVVSAGEIMVTNCTDGRLAFYSFESNDKGCEHEVDELDLKAGETGEIICEKGQSCQVGLDFVGGQWAYFKCPDIETELIDDDEILVVCSSKKKSNGFVIADRFRIISSTDEHHACADLCSK